ncbi:MAG: hypothetical protein U9O18_04730, partial [Chloroflexota bacterium]|nr:hypothetical protein [Chloroflexota bacterium]
MCATVHKAGFSVDVPEGWIATNEERVSSNLAPLPDAELWVGARSAAGDDDRPQMYGIIRFPTTARSAVGLEAAVRARLANGPP